jgi:hypothetical protein
LFYGGAFWNRCRPVRTGTGIIEAFPNAFLGVLIPGESYEQFDRKREKKSDWMYRKVTEQGTLRAPLNKLGWIEHDTINLFEEQAGRNGDHEKRAALVCLMTAGFAASSSAAVVRSTAHGWFWLPPLKCWQPWAKAALENQLKKLPAVVRWSGRIFR